MEGIKVEIKSEQEETQKTETETEIESENFLEKLYRLSNGRIHGDERQKVVRTHLKHIDGNFVHFSKEEYRKFVVNWYVARLLNRKPFSAAYLCAVIDSINRFKNFPKPPFTKREIYAVIKNMKKIFNSESKDLLFYTKTFDPITLNISNIEGLRQNNKVSKFSDKLYENANLEVLLQYNKQQLDNFLNIGTRPRIPTVQDDLALIVVFLASSPRRIKEILKLPLKKIRQLILTGQTPIKTKNGEDILHIIVPPQFSQVLNEFLITVGLGDDNKNSSFGTVPPHIKASATSNNTNRDKYNGGSNKNKNLGNAFVATTAVETEDDGSVSNQRNNNYQKKDEKKNVPITQVVGRRSDNVLGMIGNRRRGGIVFSGDMPSQVVHEGVLHDNVVSSQPKTQLAENNFNGGDEDQLLFKRSYFVYYSALKAQYKTLFSDNIGRPFHAFRNYFSAKYIKQNPDATKSALGHCSMKMTRSYANKQLSRNTTQNISQFLTENYPFAMGT